MPCPRPLQRILARHDGLTAPPLLRRWRFSALLSTTAAAAAPTSTSIHTDARSSLLQPQLQPAVLALSPRRRHASSSSTRWKSRQGKDHFAREARVAGLKSRAAYKLLELDQKHRLFRRGATVVDLGFAPGSWSQVAVSRTAPAGRVVGIDVIPAQPPRGASAIQGNFLAAPVQAEVRAYVQDYWRGRPRRRGALARKGDGAEEGEGEADDADAGAALDGQDEEEMERLRVGIVGLNAASEPDDDGGRSTVLPALQPSSVPGGSGSAASGAAQEQGGKRRKPSQDELDEAEGRVVDVVLSDMSAPWDQTSAMWVRSVSNPYYRMMNTSGMAFRDHAGSMDLCNAGLSFCYDTLRTGGHYLCKFYQGAEDKAFEMRLKKLFEKVHKEKPESSRKESKEAYFVALRRRPGVPHADVFPDES
ncbi:hypothetical protein MBLNU459_g2741t1 [Dothideomycetes sp. NU459]